NKEGIAMARAGCRENWISLSKDGGETWQDIENPWPAFDKEAPVADLSDGKYGGYVYWFGLGDNEYKDVGWGGVSATDNLKEYTLPLAVTADAETWKILNASRAKDMDVIAGTPYAFDSLNGPGTSNRFLKDVGQAVSPSGDLFLMFYS